MQNKDQSSLRTQRILDLLEKQWRRLHEPSHESFKRIAESVLTMPETYRITGLATIAEHFVNHMRLHVLALLTTFQEKAEQEGISLQEREATLQDVLPEAFQMLETLRKYVSVKSLDELAALSNITIALYTLSSTETAEEAQKWLYELPTTYLRRLRQAGLLVDEQESSKESIGKSIPTTPFVNWTTSYTSDKNQVVQEVGSTIIGVSTSTPIVLAEPVSIPKETSDPNLAA
jgi:hypothetical protein